MRSPIEAEAKSGSVLERIVELRRASVEHRKRVLPEAVLRIGVEKSSPPRDFPGALTRRPVNVVAELKRASPSRGVLRQEFDARALAAQLENAGAAALSVLTEEESFRGSLQDMKIARAATALPVLRKDFIVDPWQVWESRATEADSFLLIVAAFRSPAGDVLLRELLELGRDLGMHALVEVHTREELSRALAVGARMIGVNNRDLRTLEVGLETSFELIESIPDDCTAVCESGIHSAADIAQLRAAGFDAFLIGEHLMQSPNPAVALGQLLDTGADASG